MALLGSNVASEETCSLLEGSSVSKGYGKFTHDRIECRLTGGEDREGSFSLCCWKMGDACSQHELFKDYALVEVGLRLILCPLGSNIVVRTACCSVGIVLPVYSTFKAIERKDQNEEQKWLMYWADGGGWGPAYLLALLSMFPEYLAIIAAYGSFTLAEVFADKLISWFPMYYHMKFAFLVWLQLPSAEGAKKLYMNHLRPFLLRHQARVDRIMGFTYGDMAKLISNHQAEFEYARRVLLKITGSAGQMLKDVSNHPQGHPEVPAIEDQTRTIVDTESDHAD
ncbi:unnamed protein product [Dovyalis caffra]|uniref:HVA22-like protein n=1 Tax=Dovyalis caffra TaxID=77055 RepID=A0AAV1RVG7_9ROSI|nr:unnamed protein product [Dovyalis caffra]